MKQYTRHWLRHERGITARRLPGNTTKSDLFSDFSDVEKYDGKVPKGRYLAMVYKMYHASIRCRLSKEVKRRGAETLTWDVSYKEAKHLYQYKGNPVFKGLVTEINEIGEVCLQFHIVLDSHDQMESAIEAVKQTTSEKRHKGKFVGIGKAINLLYHSSSL